MIAPTIVLSKTDQGVAVHAKGMTKNTVTVIIAVVLSLCSALSILVILLILSRDRTSELHESLAKTIRVSAYDRLFKNLFIKSDYYPTYIKGIKRVRRVYNTVLLDNFVGAYLVQKERLNNDLFHKTVWSCNKDKVEVHNEYLSLVDSFEWNDPQYPTVVSVMHGTSCCVGEKICQTGFATLSLLDSGWYGSGIYFTSSYDYCIPYICSKRDPAIIISYVLPGNVYPVTETSFAGKPLMAGYQSHYIKTNIAGKIDKDSDYDELVICQESQILPMYIIELDPESLYPKANTVTGPDITLELY
jgi:hypothetical protein